MGASAAFRAPHIDVVSETASGDVIYRHSADGGRSWDDPLRLGGLTLSVSVARGANGVVAMIGMRSEVFRVRVSVDGGESFGPAGTIGRFDTGGGCAYDPGVPAIAVSGGVVVASFWRSERSLVVRRSTDDGATWSPPSVLSRAVRGSDQALVASGRSVLAVFATGRALVTRLSSDRGVTWSPPTVISHQVSNLAATRTSDGWHIVDALDARIRHRWSADGRVWTRPTTINNARDTDTTTLGVARVDQSIMVPFIASMWDIDQDWLVVAED
jgi:hypothetical protein